MWAACDGWRSGYREPQPVGGSYLAMLPIVNSKLDEHTFHYDDFYNTNINVMDP